MEKVQILALGTHKAIMQTIARLIDKEESWNAKIAFTLKEACEHCIKMQFDLILLGAGVTYQDEMELSKFLVKMEWNIPIVKHYGGGGGLLYAEILGGLNL